MRASALGLLAACCLGGCALFRAAPTLPAAQIQEAERRAISDWTVKARLRSDQQRASLRWRQQGETYDLLLRGPFGLGGLRIVGDAAQAEIHDGRERMVSDDPAAEIYQRTGLIVPLQALPFWMRGVTAPGWPARTERGEDGHLRRIEQAGWLIELEEYAALDAVSFPYRLRLSQAGQSLEVEVREWLPTP